MANYCTAAQIKAMAGKASTDTKFDTLINDMVSRVNELIDQATGTWFDSRQKIVYTRAAELHQGLLFMPAPIISITSIYEDGVLLDVGSYMALESSIQKTTMLVPAFAMMTAGFNWSMNAYPYGAGGAMKPGVKVTGTFGYAAVPKDIEQFAADLGAVLAGLKVKTFTTGDGIQQTVNLTTVPQYIEQSLSERMWLDLSGQERLVEAVPTP